VGGEPRGARDRRPGKKPVLPGKSAGAEAKDTMAGLMNKAGSLFRKGGAEGMAEIDRLFDQLLG